jgi:NAD(P)-dependent dehydrogenase (short-subunit alcohol dehydrogenase family)
MDCDPNSRSPIESLVGKVAVVTGAASGIGAATAAELAERGMSVLVADINGDAAENQAEAIGSSGGTAVGVGVDVSEELDVARMLDLAVDHFGRLDLLHNNAAATADSLNDADIVDMDVKLWDRTMAVNLRSAMLGCKHAIPHMLSGGGGVIVNTSSGAGTLAMRYAAKAQVSSNTESACVRDLTRDTNRASHRRVAPRRDHESSARSN